MLKDKMQAIQNKQIRGAILWLLSATDPTPTPVNSVVNALLSDGRITTPDVSKHISYLQHRGYIEVKAVPSPYTQPGLEYLKLTSTGVDVLEETITDAGVDV